MFSEDFLNGLATKSEGFQNEFFGIIDYFYDFFYGDAEKFVNWKNI